MHQAKFFILIFLFLIACSFPGAVEQASSKNPQLASPKNQEEWLVEYYLHRNLRMGSTSNIELFDYLFQLVSRTLSFADLERDEKIYFLLSDSSQFNAFANSRMVSLNLGLLLYLENLGGLVGVIAHEVAHVKLNHSLQIFQELENTNRAIPFGLMVAGAINPLFLLGSIAYTQNSQENLAQLSRRLEREADSLGFSLYLRTGLEEEGYLGLLQQLVKTSDRQQTLKYLNTHPFPIERLEHINQLVFRQDVEKPPTHSTFPPKLEALYPWYKAMARDELLQTSASTTPSLEDSPQSLELFLQARKWLAEDNTEKAREALDKLKDSQKGQETLLPVVNLEAQILLLDENYSELDEFLAGRKSFINPAPLVYAQALSYLGQNKAFEAVELLEELDTTYSGLFQPVKKNLCRAYDKAEMRFEAYICLVDLLWIQGNYTQAQENLVVAEKFAKQPLQKRQLKTKLQKNAFFVSER